MVSILSVYPEFLAVGLSLVILLFVLGMFACEWIVETINQYRDDKQFQRARRARGL